MEYGLDRKSNSLKTFNTVFIIVWLLIACFPFIWTYVAGMSRHSCKICIMSKKSDLCCSANIDPTNAIKYIVKEKEIDHTFIMPKNGKRKFLDQIITEISSQTSLF